MILGEKIKSVVRQYQNGKTEFPKVKDTTPQIHAYNMLENNMDEEYKLALAAFAFYGCGRC